MRITVQPPFYNDPDYIAALIASAEDYLKKGYDYLLFSYHGLPERQIKKSDPTGCHCLAKENCCEVASPAHATCYRAQCYQTTRAFVENAGMPREKYSVSFQSRLGKDPWLKPYTDFELRAPRQTGREEITRDLPGVCFGLSGDDRGNRHSRPRNVYASRRQRSSPDSLS